MATAQVMVACKAPNGLILNLDSYVKVGDTAVQRVDGEKTVTLKGWSRAWGMPDTTEGGYALTSVPADFWDAWFAKNVKHPLIVDKIILPPHKDASAQANDHAAVPQMHRPAREGDVPGVKKEDVAA